MLSDLYKLCKDIRQVAVYARESVAGTKGHSYWTLPIQKKGQVFFLILAKFWVADPQDTPAAGTVESINVSIDIAGNAAMGDYSQPQTIAMYRKLIRNYNNDVLIESVGSPVQWILQPIPYQRIRMQVQSTNSTTPAWAHARLIGFIIDCDPDEWAFIVSQFGSYR